MIIQASPGARGYTIDRFLIRLMQAANEVYPDVPVSLQLDHGRTARDAAQVQWRPYPFGG